MNYIQEYWNAIEVGAVEVSARVRTIYQRLAKETQEPPDGYVFDEKRARRPVEFIERFCKHSKGEWAGRPVKLELFQRAYLSALFGFVRRGSGLRRFRETLFMVGRKNGKSTLLAGLALYMLMGDGEPGAEIYSVATKKDQARLIFDEAHNMVRQSPYVGALVKKRKTDLYFPMCMGKFQPLGKNSDTLVHNACR